jgi:hypothetical protein
MSSYMNKVPPHPIRWNRLRKSDITAHPSTPS